MRKSKMRKSTLTKFRKIIKKGKQPVYTLTVTRKEPTTIRGFFTSAVEEDRSNFFFT